LQLGHEQSEALALERAFEVGGETGALIRSLDWSKTLCGPMSTWPPSLRAVVSLCLRSGLPMIFGWGPEYVQFYNDAAIPVVGDRHPWAMGRTLREVWAPEILEPLYPLTQLLMKNGRPMALDSLKVLVNRKGGPESGYFTFSFSAIGDDQGGIGGVLVTFVETTAQVLSARRLRTARDLAAHAAEAHSAEEACRHAIEAMAQNRSDIRFALIYLSDPQGTSASLVGTLGLAAGGHAAPATIALTDGDGAAAWPLARVARGGGQPILVNDVIERFGVLADPGRPAPRAALVLPATCPGDTRPAAFLVAGLNPYRPIDDDYIGFLRLVAGAIADGIANAREAQATHARAERLAELDRAKTTFLSNISHEFRTPLTLILRPIEDLLSDPHVSLAPAQREQLGTVRRNALRLLRLVNDLLAFARIEAGRMQPLFEPVDLATLTKELVSMFDSAVAHAGLRLTVDCPALPEPVYVDREMWERMVVNLLSNALKFTFEGEIAVSLKATGDRVVLVVRDTGVGIAPDELPRVFERFYRIGGARARTHEGAGIGLSLLRELARLHGGDIRVESVEGKGSTFTVEIPRGSAHLPQDRIGPARPIAPPPEVATYVEETRRWVATATPPTGPAAKRDRARILVVEDNADMREYLAGLMAERYEVATAATGAEALDRVRERLPDVVVSDVMMPELDGLQLVSALRADPRSRAVPIVLLSARAGEDAALEGLSRGADDYVVKPFSSPELLARLESHLELTRMREELAQLRLKDDFVAIASHELATPLTALNLGFELARARLEKVGPAETSALARVERAIRRIGALVDELMRVSLMQQGELPLSTERCDLGPLCRQAAEDQESVTRRTITLELHDEPVEVDVDPDAIAHVVSHLIANAVKFSTGDRPVVLTLFRSGGEAVVAIHDEGPGIPADEIPRVFERFHRVPDIEVQSGSRIGLGLGLYVCKAIVERHHGRIWVESTVGQGSTLFFALPLAAFH
jgi:signal transduction histidine kinase